MATNGFFKALKAKVFGVAKAEEKKKAAVTKPAKYQCRDGGHKGHKTGAFGGTGTGRGMRGMPCRKLIKKTVKAGWKAHHRIQFGVKRAPSTSGVGGTRMRKRLERIGAIRSWKQENAYRKAQCVILFGTKHAPKGGLEKNRKSVEKVGNK